jgi:hypothetical protein
MECLTLIDRPPLDHARGILISNYSVNATKARSMCRVLSCAFTAFGPKRTRRDAAFVSAFRCLADVLLDGNANQCYPGSIHCIGLDAGKLVETPISLRNFA